MQVKIDNRFFELISFVEETSYSKLSYLLKMDLSEVDINFIKATSSFTLINGELETTYEDVDFDNYCVESDDTITFTFFKEIGQRVDLLNKRVDDVENYIEILSEAVDFLAFGEDDLEEEGEI